MLFAQQGGFGGGGAGAGGPAPFGGLELGVLIAIMLVVFAVVLVIMIFYLLTLSRCLAKCSPRNRQMEPGMVWLNLVPCLNIVWIFITVIRIADSLRPEFRDRGLRGDGDFGRSLGITYNVLNLVGAIPYIGVLFSIGGFVCWIIYWVKIAGYSAQLDRAGPASRDYDDYDDRRRDRYDDDDRRRGRDPDDRYGERDDRYR